MGNQVSSIINGIHDSEVEAKKEARDSLNALLEMASMKHEAFMAFVKDKTDESMVPIDRILLMDYNVNASVTNDNSKVKDAVMGAVSAFAKGAILDGVASVVGIGLNAVLANVAANQSEHNTYVITCGQLGGLMRIDISIFCYAYTAESLRKIAENVVSVSYTISSVDSSQLDADTLRDVVQVCYGKAVPEDQLKAIYDLIAHAHESAKQGVVRVPDLPSTTAAPAPISGPPLNVRPPPADYPAGSKPASPGVDVPNAAEGVEAHTP